LVDNRAAGERREVDVEFPFRTLAQAECLTVERDSGCRGPSSLDTREEQLLERRHGRPSRCSNRRGLGGNLAPAEHLELLVGGQLLDAALGSGTSSRIDRQEGG